MMQSKTWNKTCVLLLLMLSNIALTQAEETLPTRCGASMLYNTHVFKSAIGLVLYLADSSWGCSSSPKPEASQKCKHISYLLLKIIE